MSKIRLKVMSDSPKHDIFLLTVEGFFKSHRQVQLDTREPILSLDQWERIRHAQPHVILVDDSRYNKVPIIQVIRQLKRSYPHIATVVVLREGTDNYDSIEFHRELLRVGASDVILLEDIPNPQDWIEPIQHAAKQNKSSKSTVQARGKIYTVHGLKGGVGRTTIATNLAAVLTENEKKVLFIDLNWPIGGSNVFFDFVPIRSVLDLLPVVNNLNQDNIRIATKSHNTLTGLDIISAPLQQQQAGYLNDIMQRNVVSPRYDGLTADLLSKIDDRELGDSDPKTYELLKYIVRRAKARQATVQLCRRLLEAAQFLYSYIVIDAPARFDEEILTILEASSTILLVTTPDVAATQALRSEIDMLGSFIPNYAKITAPILNRVRKNANDLTPDTLRKSIKLEWMPDLPEEANLSYWINSSETAIDLSRKSPFLNQMREVAEKLHTRDTSFNIAQGAAAKSEDAASRSLRKRLFGNSNKS